MKKFIMLFLFLGFIFNFAFGYTLTVNGFSRDGVDANREVTLKAVEKAGKGFVEWEVISGTVVFDDPTSMTTTFIMPAQNVSIRSTYTGDTVLTVNPGGGVYTGSYNSEISVEAPTQPDYIVTLNYNGSDDDNETLNISRDFSGWSFSGGGSVDSLAYKKINYKYGSTAGTLTASYTTESIILPTPSRVGYTFNGWYNAPSGGTKIKNGGESYTATGDITLYAQWGANNIALVLNPGGEEFTGNYDTVCSVTAPIQSYTVTYNYNGNGNTNTQEVVDKIFTHWRLSGGGSISNTTSNPTSYTFGTLGGTLTANYKDGSVILPDPIYNGYALSGWYTAPTGGTKVGDGGDSYTVSSNITLYAQWISGCYSINSSPEAYATTLQQAIDLASSGDTIKLLANINENSAVIIPADKSLTLNLAGRTINTSLNNFITLNGNLTITDSSDGSIQATVTNSKLINILGNGRLNIEGGTLVASGAGSYGIYSESETSIVTLGVNNGAIKNTPYIEGGTYAVYSKGELNYYDGTMSGTTASAHSSITATASERIFAERIGAGGKLESELIASHNTTNLSNYYNSKYNNGLGSYNTLTTSFTDLLGNTDGVLNGPTWSGNSLKFDGVDDWVNLGVKNYANPTIEVVFELDEISSYGQKLISNTDNGGYSLGVESGGHVYMEAYVGDSYKYARSIAPIESGKKYHAVGIYDGTAVKLYIDGVEVGYTEATGSIKAPDNNTVLGLGARTTSSFSSNNYLKGKIYLVRIYNGILDASGVVQNYNAAILGRDTYDIHQGATVNNNGVCSICGKKYVNISSYSYEGTSLEYQKSTVYISGATHADIEAYMPLNGTLTAIPIVMASGPILLGETTYTALEPAVATYAEGIITGATEGGILTVTATTGTYTDTMKVYVYNAIYGAITGASYNVYVSDTTTDKGLSLNANTESNQDKIYMIVGSKSNNRWNIIGLSGTDNTSTYYCDKWISAAAPITFYN